MSCSNSASRPSGVIVRAPELFRFARPNVPSLAPTSAGIGGGSRFASAAPFNFRSQSKSSGVRLESITLTLDPVCDRCDRWRTLLLCFQGFFEFWPVLVSGTNAPVWPSAVLPPSVLRTGRIAITPWRKEIKLSAINLELPVRWLCAHVALGYAECAVATVLRGVLLRIRLEQVQIALSRKEPLCSHPLVCEVWYSLCCLLLGEEGHGVVAVYRDTVCRAQRIYA